MDSRDERDESERRFCSIVRSFGFHGRRDEDVSGGPPPPAGNLVFDVSANSMYLMVSIGLGGGIG